MTDDSIIMMKNICSARLTPRDREIQINSGVKYASLMISRDFDLCRQTPHPLGFIDIDIEKKNEFIHWLRQQDVVVPPSRQNVPTNTSQNVSLASCQRRHSAEARKCVAAGPSLAPAQRRSDTTGLRLAMCTCQDAVASSCHSDGRRERCRRWPWLVK